MYHVRNLSADKIFIPAESELFIYDSSVIHGFSPRDAVADRARQFQPTDYAVWKGAWSASQENVKGNVFWITRTMGYTRHWGTQSGMFFSPEIWRDIYKPEIQRAVDRCHELGMIYEQHSCGNIEVIVPEMAEMGIDAWQGQEINDIPGLKEITKNTMSYHVTPVYMEYETAAEAGTIDEAGIRAIVAERFHKAARGYNYAPMFLPFGGWASAAMRDEIFKLAKTEYQAEWS